MITNFDSSKYNFNWLKLKEINLILDNLNSLKLLSTLSASQQEEIINGISTLCRIYKGYYHKDNMPAIFTELMNNIDYIEYLKTQRENWKFYKQNLEEDLKKIEVQKMLKTLSKILKQKKKIEKIRIENRKLKGEALKREIEESELPEDYY